VFLPIHFGWWIKLSWNVYDPSPCNFRIYRVACWRVRGRVCIDTVIVSGFERCKLTKKLRARLSQLCAIAWMKTNFNYKLPTGFQVYPGSSFYLWLLWFYYKVITNYIRSNRFGACVLLYQRRLQLNILLLQEKSWIWNSECQLSVHLWKSIFPQLIHFSSWFKLCLMHKTSYLTAYIFIGENQMVFLFSKYISLVGENEKIFTKDILRCSQMKECDW